ncbi:hypothetical protein PTSG_11732 [Salpingoeca rosetta]|uniref:SPRY domain-containing protein n=1 Tax=Salpingoeca rosetta (strain ATCC 50818 / BSB-021) TaxID=946362 RepID=F2U0D2_SALR5|nr:uncharacterized protein PTSG_11732 [Salpingoeca rosetta]EGD80860.1 hypothetical protein PTSG_11732 [Salpingoeca rosetta]|eukprot:XP_004997421.1 hypothetical protein PTSG_11732 [Salpingoeca rosetta]
MGVSGLSETRQPHWRIGWAQRHGAVQAPCGFDRFSYSWRDIDGQKFHNSRGAPFSKEGYGPGDVLGFEIVLPQRVTSRVLPIQTRGTHVSVVAQGNTFIAEKQKLSTPELFEAVPGSKIICYKNGVCQGVMFEDINCGTYYPAISLYNHAQVVANFGPTFKFPPPNKECRPISAAAAYTHAALSLAESIARVVNTRDVPAQKKEVREKLLDSGKVDTASACASSGSGSASSGSTATTSTATAATAAGDLGEGEALDDMKPPPYHPRMALSARKKFRAFLLRQRVFIDQETFETLPSRLQPRTTPDTHYI